VQKVQATQTSLLTVGPISLTSVRLIDGSFQWNYSIAFVFDQNEPITVDRLRFALNS